jgi:hypothetical protein
VVIDTREACFSSVNDTSKAYITRLQWYSPVSFVTTRVLKLLSINTYSMVGKVSVTFYSSNSRNGYAALKRVVTSYCNGTVTFKIRERNSSNSLHSFLKGLCHQFRIILNLFHSKALGIDIWRLILNFFNCLFNL